MQAKPHYFDSWLKTKLIYINPKWCILDIDVDTIYNIRIQITSNEPSKIQMGGTTFKTHDLGGHVAARQIWKYVGLIYSNLFLNKLNDVFFTLFKKRTMTC